MKFVEVYQIPMGNVSPDIFKLPCIVAACKTYPDGIGYAIGGMMKHARPSEWLCKDKKGNWHVMTNEEYRRMKK